MNAGTGISCALRPKKKVSQCSDLPSSSLAQWHLGLPTDGPTVCCPYFGLFSYSYSSGYGGTPRRVPTVTPSSLSSQSEPSISATCVHALTSGPTKPCLCLGTIPSIVCVLVAYLCLSSRLNSFPLFWLGSPAKTQHNTSTVLFLPYSRPLSHPFLCLTSFSQLSHISFFVCRMERWNHLKCSEMD